MSPDELPLIRHKVYEGPPCPIDKHYWAEVNDGLFTLFVLCRNCGRTPIEMFDALTSDLAIPDMLIGGHDDD